MISKRKAASAVFALVLLLSPVAAAAQPHCPSLVLNGVTNYATGDRSVFPDSSALASFTAEAWVYMTFAPKPGDSWLIMSDNAYDLRYVNEHHLYDTG